MKIEKYFFFLLFLKEIIIINKILELIFFTYY